MNKYESSRSSQLDSLETILGNQRCLAVVEYLRESSTEVLSVTELASELAEQNDSDGLTRQNDSDKHQWKIHLHHTVLPRLSEHGVVDYDPRTTTVRYLGSDQMERALEHGFTGDGPQTHLLMCRDCGQFAAALKDGESLSPASDTCQHCESARFKNVHTGETIRTDD